MKIIKIFLLSLGVILLSGCASKQSLKTSTTNETICSEKSTKSTYTLLLKGIKKHYTGSEDKATHTDEGMLYNGTIMVPASGTTSIESKIVSIDKYEIYVSIKNGISPQMYGELIEIYKGKNGCKTEVKISYMNRFWKQHGMIVKSLLK